MGARVVLHIRHMCTGVVFALPHECYEHPASCCLSLTLNVHACHSDACATLIYFYGLASQSRKSPFVCAGGDFSLCLDVPVGSSDGQLESASQAVNGSNAKKVGGRHRRAGS